MPYVVGILLSMAVALLASRAGFDRDRAFYPTVLIVIASYYVLFAVMSESVHTVLLEFILTMGFSIAAVVGFKSSVDRRVVGWPATGFLMLPRQHPAKLRSAGLVAGLLSRVDLGAAGGLAWVIKRRPRSQVPSRSA